MLSIDNGRIYIHMQFVTLVKFRTVAERKVQSEILVVRNLSSA